MKSIREYIEAVEQDIPHWKQCRSEDPAVQRLCVALCDWVEGRNSNPEVQATLLSLETVAEKFTSPWINLYRGFMPSDDQWVSLESNGYFDIESDPHTPLASWSSERETCVEFMDGYESAWVVMKKNDLNIFCDLADFAERAGSFTQMGSQDEIIVKMDPTVRITRDEIVHFSPK